MLQSLLPGLRHLRAPLTAGYIWLFALWLTSRDALVSQSQLLDVSSRIAEIATWAGKPATLAAITLLAYLVGIISIAVTTGVGRIAKPLRVVPLRWLVPNYWLNKSIDISLGEVIERRLSEHYVDDPKFRDALKKHLSDCKNKAKISGDNLISSAYEVPEDSRIEQKAIDDEFWRRFLVRLLVDNDQYVDSAKEDVEQLAYRLLGKEEKVYEEYDRRRSEGIFRLALVLPLAFLFLALSHIGGVEWLLGLPIPIVFAYLAAASFAEAKRGLASAVSSGRVELPSLERLRTRDVKLRPYESLVARHRPPLPDSYSAPDRWKLRPWPK